MKQYLKVSIGLSFLVMALPALAHNVELAGDIAGTWHVEPDHSPRAGEPAQVWVALTREGGTLLPLEQANCQLSVYNAPRQPDDRPILQPDLAPLSVEQYQGIPSATLTFPATGLYELALDCRPKTDGDFSPFEMTYEVTVATGQSIASPVPAVPPEPVPETSPNVSSEPSPQASASPEPAANPLLVGIGGIAVILTIGGVLAATRFLRKR